MLSLAIPLLYCFIAAVVTAIFGALANLWLGLSHWAVGRRDLAANYFAGFVLLAAGLLVLGLRLQS